MPKNVIEISGLPSWVANMYNAPSISMILAEMAKSNEK